MTKQSGPVLIYTIKEMQTFSNNLRMDGKTISFVPTMGALHEGHLSLLRGVKSKADVLVLSIFVNPTQFGPGEDYQAYTRDIEGDLKKIESIGVDAVFLPTADEIYPSGFQTYVEITELQKPLCGRFRPGHFKGVATVVLKLFNAVKPNVAVFGRKDYQQLRVIEQMVQDLNLEVEIIAMPTVREDSGLALSSRNAYLNPEELIQAKAISNSLREIKKEFNTGTKTNCDLIQIGETILNKAGITQIEYFEIRDSYTLEENTVANKGDVVAVAARVGKARLIDNIEL